MTYLTGFVCEFEPVRTASFQGLRAIEGHRRPFGGMVDQRSIELLLTRSNFQFVRRKRLHFVSAEKGSKLPAILAVIDLYGGFTLEVHFQMRLDGPRQLHMKRQLDEL